MGAKPFFGHSQTDQKKKKCYKKNLIITAKYDILSPGHNATRGHKIWLNLILKKKPVIAPRE